MEGNENLVIKQEQKFDTSIVKIEPDLKIQFEERICVKKEPFELKPDDRTFRVPSGITLEPPSSIKRPEIIERPSLPPTPVLLNTPHKKYRRIVQQNLAIDFTATTGNQGATNSTSPTPPSFHENSESDNLDHRSRESSPDNLVIAETSSTTSSTELDSTSFKPPCPDRLQGIETPEWVHTPHTEVFEMNLKDYCQSKAEEDYLKDIRRRIKNRESAKRSRLKKFKSIEQLREEYRILRKKEQEIRAEKRDAEEYCKYWESQVQALEREKYFLEDRKRRRLYSADM